MAFLKSLIYVLVLGIVSHYVGEALPRRWFHWNKFPYKAWKWEQNGSIYEKIRIRDWKDRVPDMSRIMKDMVPKRVGISPSSQHVWALVKETCVAEAVHVVLCVLSHAIYLFWHSGMGIFLTYAVIVCNLPFILIQRYNRPALAALAQRLEKREERKRNAHAHSVGKHGLGA